MTKSTLQEVVALSSHQGLKEGQHYLVVETRSMWVVGREFKTYFVSPVGDQKTIIQVNNGHLMFGFIN